MIKIKVSKLFEVLPVVKKLSETGFKSVKDSLKILLLVKRLKEIQESFEILRRKAAIDTRAQELILGKVPSGPDKNLAQEIEKICSADEEAVKALKSYDEMLVVMLDEIVEISCERVALSSLADTGLSMAEVLALSDFWKED